LEILREASCGGGNVERQIADDEPSRAIVIVELEVDRIGHRHNVGGEGSTQQEIDES